MILSCNCTALAIVPDLSLFHENTAAYGIVIQIGKGRPIVKLDAVDTFLWSTRL